MYWVVFFYGVIYPKSNKVKLEESKLTPEDNNSIEASSERKKESNKDEEVEESTEFLEKATTQDVDEGKVIFESREDKSEIKNNSLLKRIINEGFDGITSNPNYKLLALLIILLINLSLFFVIGNIGKAFLKNAGIMG